MAGSPRAPASDFLFISEIPEIPVSESEVPAEMPVEMPVEQTVAEATPLPTVLELEKKVDEVTTSPLPEVPSVPAASTPAPKEAPPLWTSCRYTWPNQAYGWRWRTWQLQDCSHGLPPNDWLSIGQAANGNGTRGQVQCSIAQGGHYNHLGVQGDTGASVLCLYMAADVLKNRHPQKQSPVTFCRADFVDLTTGWRERAWQISDCSHGLPTNTSLSLGMAVNSNGTGGEARCAANSGLTYTHPVIDGPSRSSLTCLFINSEALAQATGVGVPVTKCSDGTGPEPASTGWQSYAWNAEKCSHGLPAAAAWSLGESSNGNGTGGQVSCSLQSGAHYNHPQVNGATSRHVGCLFLSQSAPPKRAASPTNYSHDLDANGESDTNLSLAKCVNSNELCVTVGESTLTTSRIIVVANSSSERNSGLELQPIGSHFGGLGTVAVAHWSGQRPALTVIDLDEKVVSAQALGPVRADAASSFYFRVPRGPDGKGYPFIAPAYGDGVMMNTAAAWNDLCLFVPGAPAMSENNSQQASCGSHFVRSDASHPLPGYGMYRDVGAYFQDLDGDGWEDVNLIYHAGVRSYSLRTGLALGSTTFDVAEATLPTAPKWFHGGRSYGSHAASRGRDGLLRNTIVGGIPVGDFNDSMCNVSRYLAVLESNPGQAQSRRMSWSRYFGFHSHIYQSFDPSLIDNPPVAVPGQFLHNCIHRMGDSRSEMDSKDIVIINVFKAAQAVDLCHRELYNLSLPPAWTTEKANAWGICHVKNLQSSGVWHMEVFDEKTGQTLTGSSHVYLWGKSSKLHPSGEAIYFTQVFSGTVIYAQTAAAIGRLQLKGLSNSRFVDFGSLPVSGKPKIAVAGESGGRGQGAYSYFADLVEQDRDGDGFNEVQMESGEWVGYSQSRQAFVVKD